MQKGSVEINLFDYYPLKQGLKHVPSVVPSAAAKLFDYYPLKQGLKQGMGIIGISIIGLFDYYPLKQGLKQRKKYYFEQLFDFLTTIH